MQYTKPMIDLVLQIRKNAPAQLKPAVKLADPNLLHTLARHYQHLDDANLRKSVAQLMALAGPTWSQLLTSVAASDAPEPNSSPPAAPAPAMMYRGQRISR